MHKLIDYLCDELDNLERKAENGNLSMAEIQYGDTLAHFKKNLLKADEMSNYSNDWYPRNTYRRRHDGYSRRYSMSEGMIDELHELMNRAPDDRTKREFEKFISKIETM